MYYVLYTIYNAHEILKTLHNPLSDTFRINCLGVSVNFFLMSSFLSVD